MPRDIPPGVTAALDQKHAASDAALSRFLDRLTADGLADLAAPERTIGVGLALAGRSRAAIVEIAACAVARLLDCDNQLEMGE
jgi:hypothetical protein